MPNSCSCSLVYRACCDSACLVASAHHAQHARAYAGVGYFVGSAAVTFNYYFALGLMIFIILLAMPWAWVGGCRGGCWMGGGCRLVRGGRNPSTLVSAWSHRAWVRGAVVGHWSQLGQVQAHLLLHA